MMLSIEIIRHVASCVLIRWNSIMHSDLAIVLGTWHSTFRVTPAVVHVSLFPRSCRLR